MNDDELIAALRVKAANVESRAPASIAALERTEAALGFSIDPFLRRVYLEVGDGAVGPGYGTLPLEGEESLASTYTNVCADDWPKELLPVWNWGDAIWSCVDTAGRLVTIDDVGEPMLTDFTTRTWLRAWVDGVHLWNELFDDKEVTILDPFTRKPVTTKARNVVKGRPWVPQR